MNSEELETSINEQSIEDSNSMMVAENEDFANQELKSIEINLNVLKSFFSNTISFYELAVKTVCKSCNLVESEEFVNLHRTLLEFDGIFKVFDVAFNKNLMTSLVTKHREPQIIQLSSHLNDSIMNDETIVNPDNTMIEDYDLNVSTKISCFLNSCSQLYSTEEGAKIHFIKNHCKLGDIFQKTDGSSASERSGATVVDFSKVQKDKSGRFLCDFDDCNYATNDRSNFKVHLKRHTNNRKFLCVCGKRFFTRDPLMIHFVRLHMKDVDWTLANRDIRSLRKTIRRLVNRRYHYLQSNDDFSDSDSDLNGPQDQKNDELTEYITQAISTTAVNNDGIIEFNNHPGGDEEKIQLEENNNSVLYDETPMNTFNVSVNMRDNNIYTDSVTFKSEGAEAENIDHLIKNPSDAFTTTMSLSTTKDKIVNKNIPQRHRKYKCPHKFCQQDFFTTKNLLIHMKASHDPKNPIPCQEPGCGARFKSTALLAQHQKRHRVQYSCQVCSYKTHLAALMTRHNRQHAGESLSHECSTCQEKFEYLGALRTHRQKVHKEKEPLQCDWFDCFKKFKTIIGLKKHKREIHLNMKSELPCDWPECSAVFSNRTSLTNHMRIHTDERPYQCDWQDCGKWFRLKETLKRHIKLHQGYRPHVCPFDNCDQSFLTKRNLKSHIENGHLKQSSNTPTDLEETENSTSRIKEEINEEVDEGEKFNFHDPEDDVVVEEEEENERVDDDEEAAIAADVLC